MSTSMGTVGRRMSSCTATVKALAAFGRRSSLGCSAGAQTASTSTIVASRYRRARSPPHAWWPTGSSTPSTPTRWRPHSAVQISAHCRSSTSPHATWRRWGTWYAMPSWTSATLTRRRSCRYARSCRCSFPMTAIPTTFPTPRSTRLLQLGPEGERAARSSGKRQRRRQLLAVPRTRSPPPAVPLGPSLSQLPAKGQQHQSLLRPALPAARVAAAPLPR
mmetsp:Transcript_51754/g.110698  ORF Transcript_51754/g.110698 Transcript_51754/m.110698 type:complete len:219 (+) Transcript_51754:274-930(+)